jgi:hypothetical protein
VKCGGGCCRAWGHEVELEVEGEVTLGGGLRGDRLGVGFDLRWGCTAHGNGALMHAHMNVHLLLLLLLLLCRARC